MKIAYLRIPKLFVGFLLALIIALGVAPITAVSATIPSSLRLADHVPVKAVAAAALLGPLEAATDIPMTIALPLRNQPDLHDLLGRIYDPADPLYGHYLTPQEFTDRFGPTQADYDAVTDYVRSLGLTVTGTHPNRSLLDVSGPARTVEAAFNLHLHHYQAKDGRKFYAPDNDPEVPDSVISRITGIIGLDNFSIQHTHSRFVSAAEMTQTSPLQIGSGPGGGLTPSDILAAYNLQGVAANGSGQTLGLFELDGYNASDVANYVSHYALPSITLQNVLVDGFSGAAGSGAGEVTLDIELQMALAPGVSKIIVYEGPNSDKGVLDTYNRIATDNLAKQVSTSWGASEDQSSSTVITSENAIFQQMAAQGQSIYAASGDNGAYDDLSTLSVDDPASQPLVVGVGGTQLSVNSNKTFNYETTWNFNNKASGGAGGGGVSSRWSIPAWQQGITSASSITMRNVPDVSLNADPGTGYSIYYKGSWAVYGGTSCAAPLWAAFTARVNQYRAANGNPPLGFANPALYKIATGDRYGADFHDVADGSTNIYYAAITGYDNATGWGSFNGANLLTDLTSTTVPGAPGAPTIGTVTAGNAQATVAFTPPASSGGSPITSYTVTSSPGGFTASGTASPITVTGLTNGTAYTFTVTATNAAGIGAASAASVSVTPATIPGAPTIGTVMAGNAQATVAFTPPASSGGSPITRYTVTSSPGGFTAIGTSSPITVTGLTNGTTYTFTVTATNSVGTSAPSSASSNVTPSPTTPIIINNGSSYTNKTSVSLTLTYPGAAFMQFSTNGTTWTTWGAFVATKRLTFSSGDGLKTVSVRFKDSNNVISSVYSATITLDTKKPANGTLTITPGPGVMTLNWQGFSDTTSDIAGYRLVMGNTSYPACTATPFYEGTNTSHIQAGIVSGKTYYFRVCALDNAGNISTGATAKLKAP